MNTKNYGVLGFTFSLFLIFGCAAAASAKVYTLGYENLKAAFAATPISLDANTTDFSIDFTEGEAVWTMKITMQPAEAPKIANYTSSKGYFNLRSGNEFIYTNVSFSTNFFKDKSIKSVAVDASLYNKNSETEKQIISVLSGNEVIGQKECALPLRTGLYGQSSDEEVNEILVNAQVNKQFSISFSHSSGCDFGIKSILVEYEESPAPVVQHLLTIPVGHKVEITADSADAEIFFNTDDSENWHDYDSAVGVVFNKPGVYTLKYFARHGEAISEVVSEEISVVKPSGFHAAVAANQEVTVSGEVCALTPAYLLLGVNSEATADECLAVDISDYPDLKSARIGTKLTVTGRPTDRFGATTPALGSISEMIVDGIPSLPTKITSPNTPHAESPRYNLKGQRVSASGTTLRQIVISANGAKSVGR